MFGDWRPYVSAAQRRAAGLRHAASQRKKGIAMSPVIIGGRAIATSFWGKAWCENLESYSDYSNRLPRGRTYARNGSVIDLQIGKAAVRGQVSGSMLYKTSVHVTALAPKRWTDLVKRHASQVGSIVDLLQGRLPQSLLGALADRSSGLFPHPSELKFECSCPDYASMCKHVAAVLYGVGARLDHQPELFFLLRGVEVSDLATRGAAADFAAAGMAGDLAKADLGALFGIEMEEALPGTPAKAKVKPAPKARVAPKKKVVAKAKKKVTRRQPSTGGRTKR